MHMLNEPALFLPNPVLRVLAYLGVALVLVLVLRHLEVKWNA
jgi:hypothetical protein